MQSLFDPNVRPGCRAAPASREDAKHAKEERKTPWRSWRLGVIQVQHGIQCVPNHDLAEARSSQREDISPRTLRLRERSTLLKNSYGGDFSRQDAKNAKGVVCSSLRAWRLGVIQVQHGIQCVPNHNLAEARSSQRENISPRALRLCETSIALNNSCQGMFSRQERQERQEKNLPSRASRLRERSFNACLYPSAQNDCRGASE